MAGAITLTNLANYSLGIALDETSINIQKLTVKAMTEKIEVKDRVGRIIGRVDHALKQEYNIEGFIDVASGGILASQIGVILTVAGVVGLGGMPTTGACILDESQLDYETAQLAKISYKLTRYADIPSTATQVNI